jgi:hypothetical protein
MELRALVADVHLGYYLRLLVWRRKREKKEGEGEGEEEGRERREKAL